MSVPEPEKGHEECQDEETPEPVLLIRLDEADALVHLRSMVSNRSSASLPSFLPSLFLSLSFPGHGVEGNRKFDLRHRSRVH